MSTKIFFFLSRVLGAEKYVHGHQFRQVFHSMSWILRSSWHLHQWIRIFDWCLCRRTVKTFWRKQCRTSYKLCANYYAPYGTKNTKILNTSAKIENDIIYIYRLINFLAKSKAQTRLFCRHNKRRQNLLPVFVCQWLFMHRRKPCRQGTFQSHKYHSELLYFGRNRGISEKKIRRWDSKSESSFPGKLLQVNSWKVNNPHPCKDTEFKRWYSYSVKQL